MWIWEWICWGCSGNVRNASTSAVDNGVDARGRVWTAAYLVPKLSTRIHINPSIYPVAVGGLYTSGRRAAGLFTGVMSAYYGVWRAPKEARWPLSPVSTAPMTIYCYLSIS